MRRLLLLAGLVALAFALWASGRGSLLSWSSLARNHQMLAAWVQAHPVLSAAGFVVAYAASTVLSLPVGALWTMSAGLLFGSALGAGLAVLGATTGATLLFLIARSTLGKAMATRGGARMQALRVRLRRYGFQYLLAIRLVPLFPFWLINLAAALCGMRLNSYIAATALGILPTTAVYAWTGAGIGDVLAAGGRPDLRVIFSLPVLGPLLALAALSLVPLLWRRRPADA